MRGGAGGARCCCGMVMSEVLSPGLEAAGWLECLRACMPGWRVLLHPRVAGAEAFRRGLDLHAPSAPAQQG